MDFSGQSADKRRGVIASLRLRFALREGGLTVGPGALGAVL